MNNNLQRILPNFLAGQTGGKPSLFASVFTLKLPFKTYVLFHVKKAIQIQRANFYPAFFFLIPFFLKPYASLVYI